VLVVPTEAITFDKGREVCYVATSNGLERRRVRVGQATQDLLEVTAGLDEGEQVVLDPTRAELDPELVVDRTPEPVAPAAGPAQVVASTR